MAKRRKKPKVQAPTISASTQSLLIIQLVIAFEWLVSAQEKFLKAEYMETFAKTVSNYAAKTSYDFYTTFLNDNVLPNANAMANIVRFGELLAGALLAGLAIKFLIKKTLPKNLKLFTAVVLIAAAALNINYYFAASYMGPATAGINVIMAGAQLSMAYYYLRAALAK